MVRVLQIGLSNNKGGIESFVLNYYRNIDREHIQFDFLDNYGDLAYADEIQRLGGKIIRVPDFHKNPIKYAFALNKVMRNYNVVHINMLSLANIIPILVARMAKVKKIVIHAHSTQALGGNRRRLDSFNKSIILKMDLVRLACSEKAGKWMFKDSSFEILKNAIDVPKFEYDLETRNEERRKIGIEENQFVCGNVAALMEEKNHKFLLELFSEVLRARPNSMLLIVGSGVLMDELKNLAERMEIDKKTIFLGSRSDVDHLYNVFDCFVLPSVFEGAPFTLVEAQANGLKCYVSKDRVSVDNDLLGTMEFLSLEDGAKVWGNAICQNDHQRVENAADKIIQEGFYIKNQIHRLEEIYVS